MRELTPKQIADLKAKGAEIEIQAQLVDSPSLIAAMKEIAAANQAQTRAGQEKIQAGLERLIKTIAEKQVGTKTDLSELVAAVAGLKQEVIVINEPVDYHLTFKRDQRQLIDGEKGLRFTALPKQVN